MVFLEVIPTPVEPASQFPSCALVTSFRVWTHFGGKQQVWYVDNQFGHVLGPSTVSSWQPWGSWFRVPLLPGHDSATAGGNSHLHVPAGGACGVRLESKSKDTRPTTKLLFLKREAGPFPAKEFPPEKAGPSFFLVGWFFDANWDWVNAMRD